MNIAAQAMPSKNARPGSLAAWSTLDDFAKGSNVVATDDVKLTAKRDIAITAATEKHNESHFKQSTEDGIFSSGGVGFTIGSIDGNVSLTAGNNYRQVGSDVITPNGNIDVTAKRIDIVEARETSKTVTETKTKQSGLTVAVSSPVITAIQTAQQMSEAAKNTQDTRMKLLAAANVGLQANNTYDAIAAGQGGTPAQQAGGINVSVSIGSSKSQSKTTQESNTAVGSTLKAGGNITLTATGAGKDSDITVQGSDLIAGNNLTLRAEDEIKLLAAADTAGQRSTNSSSSASVGISYGTDGLLVNVGASGSKGKANGNDLAWNNTHVSAGNIVTLVSGTDTTLKGAVVSGEKVVANVGTSGYGNLVIESLQDQSTYDSKQQSAGVSVSVGMGRMSGSVSFSQSTINSDYASVTEQSGIKAGDGGFEVKVKGDTTSSRLTPRYWLRSPPPQLRLLLVIHAPLFPELRDRHPSTRLTRMTDKPHQLLLRLIKQRVKRFSLPLQIKVNLCRSQPS